METIALWVESFHQPQALKRSIQMGMLNAHLQADDLIVGTIAGATRDLGVKDARPKSRRPKPDDVPVPVELVVYAECSATAKGDIVRIITGLVTVLDEHYSGHTSELGKQAHSEQWLDTDEVNGYPLPYQE